uniref:Uncharacterized protein n=1 Tax=uncultured marine group II/III euryarchaeote KM3_87_G11 TaxID=1456534 RepID=A0A075I1F3_9EURY|nr:hypothetical protein [uncultured marine group II/III euryarchaeote KM3_87_G11]
MRLRNHHAPARVGLAIYAQYLLTVPAVMEPTTLAVLLAGVLLTGCHIFAVWLMMTSRKDAGDWAGNLGATLSFIADHAAEAGRIASDIADAIERMESGFGVEAPIPSPAMTGAPNLAGLATSLITDYIAANIHGSTEPSGAIYEQEAETPPESTGSGSGETTQ